MAKIIAFEGLSGCGKTTVIEGVIRDLENRGIKTAVVNIKTIGDAPVLHTIARKHPLTSRTRLLLLWTLRLQQSVAIQEMSQEFDVIIADRFWGSTMALDIYGNGVPEEILSWVMGDILCTPDLTFFLEAPIETLRVRKDSPTLRDPYFAKRTEHGFQILADKFSWIRVDAAQEPEKVKDECLHEILSRLRI